MSRGPGRPPNEVPSEVRVITLTLHPKHDQDIISLIDGAPHGEKAATVIAAMRSGDGLAAFLDHSGPAAQDHEIDLSGFLC